MKKGILLSGFLFFFFNMGSPSSQVQQWSPQMIRQLDQVTKSQPTILRKVNSKDKVLFNTVVHHLKQKNTTAAVTFWKKLHKRLKNNMREDDITKVLYEAIRQSMVETRQDKEYYLRKIASYNQSKKVTREHLRDLNQETGKHDQGADQKTSSKKDLKDTINEIKKDQESLREKRQAAQTSFQAADEKANQMHNVLSQLLKVLANERGVASHGSP